MPISFGGTQVDCCGQAGRKILTVNNFLKFDNFNPKVCLIKLFEWIYGALLKLHSNRFMTSIRRKYQLYCKVAYLDTF